MKNLSLLLFSGSLSLAIILSVQSTARATPFLSVDVESTSGATTQAGFTSWGVAAAGAE